MQTYQKHLTDFDSYLTLKNYSKTTRSAYSCALRQFFVYREKQEMFGGGHSGSSPSISDTPSQTRLKVADDQWGLFSHVKIL